MPSKQHQSRLVFVGITLAVLAWGVFHAFGALRLNGNPWRAVVVLACSIGFLAFWWLMLAMRRRRTAGGRQE
jgi:lipopolysaccharide export LptBFGC system permease protein LptF